MPSGWIPWTRSGQMFGLLQESSCVPLFVCISQLKTLSRWTGILENVGFSPLLNWKTNPASGDVNKLLIGQLQELASLTPTQCSKIALLKGQFNLKLKKICFRGAFVQFNHLGGSSGVRAVHHSTFFITRATCLIFCGIFHTARQTKMKTCMTPNSVCLWAYVSPLNLVLKDNLKKKI